MEAGGSDRAALRTPQVRNTAITCSVAVGDFEMAEARELRDHGRDCFWGLGFEFPGYIVADPECVP